MDAWNSKCFKFKSNDVIKNKITGTLWGVSCRFVDYDTGREVYVMNDNKIMYANVIDELFEVVK